MSGTGAGEEERGSGCVLGLGALPASMRDGIEQRHTEPAQRDDPATSAARLAALRARAVVSGAAAGAAGAADEARPGNKPDAGG